MVKPLIFSLFTPPLFLEKFKIKQQYDFGHLILREFPDKECYIKYDTEIENRALIFIASLDNPNQKILPLIFSAKAAKDLGAKEIGLIVPYLPYMRQDSAFLSGEAVTSKYFSEVLSGAFDWLITIDPHLHRYHSLNDLYKIPTFVLHATIPIANWITAHISNPLLIGPDNESQQWVAAIAKLTKAPFLVLEKSRKGDKTVEIHLPNLRDYKDLTPILVDDIISTGTTLTEILKQLKIHRMQPAICIGVHAIFAGTAYQDLLDAGAAAILTCNTIKHVSNKIDIAEMILEKLNALYLLNI